MVQLTPDYPGPKPARWSYLRSFLPYILLVLTLAFGLSSYSLLSHFRGPAERQQIGWQAYDTIEFKKPATGTQEDVDTGAEEHPEAQEDYVPSIPLDNWDPLAFHTTGLTEIAVKPCYFPPFLFGSYCAPETTGELDKTKGKWVIVEKDLNLRTGLWYLNIYYRRTRRLDVPLISDIRIVAEPAPNELSSELEGWTKADGNLHSGIWPSQPEMRLWYKLEAQSWMHMRGINKTDHDHVTVSKKQNVNFSYGEMITEVDVVYGDDDPFYGFERIQGGPFTATKQGKWESVDVAVRRGTYTPPKADRPTFHDDGTFKIMQIADLHYSVGNGQCRDTDKQPCVGDPETEDWLGQALDLEKPDMVVFSGDQLNGQETSYDARSVLAKFAKPVIDRQIPWTAIFGNHDSEINDDRAEQMRMLMNMPYSLAQAGPENVEGVGNYLVKLYSGDASRMHIFTLYFIDSHAYEPKSVPWAKADYDWIKESALPLLSKDYAKTVRSQIKWFLNASHSIDPIERPFRPDGAEDLGHVWERRSQPSRLHEQRQTKLAKPNAMMWFHIPLPEAQNEADRAGYDAEELSLGDHFDGPGNSKHNGGMFYNGIKQAYENDEQAADESPEGRVNEVKVLGHGHSHNTDRCRRIDGIWMCFDGGSSFSGYGQLGFDRRVRVYTISEFGETVLTYKRLSSGEIIDQQVLIGTGAPEGAGMDQVHF